MSTLNPNAEKWVQALESGRFKQGAHVLHRKEDDARCCLGVACALAIEDGVAVVVDTDEDDFCVTYDGRTGGLPQSVERWVGLNSGMGYLSPDCPLDCTLASLNDMGKSFAEIAQIIRDNADTLFVEA
jgi:hypothetical protein